MNQLPSSPGAEKSILSNIFQDPANNLDRALELGVTAEWFHGYRERKMWEILTRRLSKGESMDLVSLTQSVIDSGESEEIGGAAAITEIYTYAATSANLEAHISDVKVKYAARKVYEVSSKALEASLNVSDSDSLGDTLNLLSEPVSGIFALINGTSNRATAKPLMKDWANDYAKRMAGEDLQVMPCRFSGLERLYGGLITPAYMIVTALPSSGKTALATQLMNGVSEGGGKCIAFSLEMSKMKLADRMIINESGVSGDVITKPHLNKPTKGELVKIKNSINAISERDFIIHEEASMHVDKICSLARSEHRRSPISFIWIDYAQLMKGNREKGDSLETMYADISHKLQALQKELKCTVCVLSQTTVDSQGNFATKYAKVFEEDADLWLHIIRDKGQEDIEDVVVMKCRHHGYNGKMLRMDFNKQIQRFQDKPYNPNNG